MEFNVTLETAFANLKIQRTVHAISNLSPHKE